MQAVVSLVSCRGVLYYSDLHVEVSRRGEVPPVVPAWAFGRGGATRVAAGAAAESATALEVILHGDEVEAGEHSYGFYYPGVVGTAALPFGGDGRGYLNAAGKLFGGELAGEPELGNGDIHIPVVPA